MHRIVNFGLSGCTIFFNIISQRHDFRKKKITEHKMFVLIFSAAFFFLKHFSFPEEMSEIDQKRILFFMYSTSYSFQILKNLEFSNRFSKNTQIINLLKIRPVGTELFHAERTDRQTGLTQLIVAFRNSAKAPQHMDDFI